MWFIYFYFLTKIFVFGISLQIGVCFITDSSFDEYIFSGESFSRLESRTESRGSNFNSAISIIQTCWLTCQNMDKFIYFLASAKWSPFIVHGFLFEVSSPAESHSFYFWIVEVEKYFNNRYLSTYNDCDKESPRLKRLQDCVYSRLSANAASILCIFFDAFVYAKLKILTRGYDIRNTMMFLRKASFDSTSAISLSLKCTSIKFNWIIFW